MSPEEAREHILAGKTEAVQVDGTIDLQGTGIETLQCAVTCNDLIVSNTPLRSIPKKLTVRSRLVFDNCRHLEKLPSGLHCGSLSLRGCTFLAGLPKGLQTWFVDASDCPRLADWPSSGSIRFGNVRLRNCVEIRSLPAWIGPLGQLDVAGCVNLHHLPEGLQVSAWIDIGGSSIKELPASLKSVALRWRGVPVDHTIAFEPETLTAERVLAERNAELRRVMIERMGYLRFAESADAKVLDEDADAGGTRQLLRIKIADDEPLVGLACRCPSTSRQYFLRVPPSTKTCHEAAAWMAGFDDPSHYNPVLET